ncbi:MAG: glycine--tRNA ligase, partial [Acidimicrobiia bacterium]
MTASLETISNLAKRRGFVFASSEIYGGTRSAYDYGPLGAVMLRNVKEQWWRSMVQTRGDVVGLDSAIIQNRAVWRASGHEEVFTDPLVECRNCNARHRVDKLDDPDKCPTCGKTGTFTEPRQFNLM